MARGDHWHQPDRTKVCIRCGETKGLGDFYAYSYTTNQGNRSTRFESRCKPCARERRIAERNVDREKATTARWRQTNRERLAAENRRKQQIPEYRAMKAYHQRLRKARMRSGEGDTPEVRAIYAEAAQLEALIQNCPLFDLPELGKKLQVDHIKPLARGGRHEASNLQILPIGINLRKGATSWER